MRIGIYCNKDNINNVIELFQDMFPTHKTCVEREITENSFITTQAYKIVKYDFENPEYYNYDVCSLENFKKKHPFVKGDIVKWSDYEEPYKIIGINGKGQEVKFEIVDEDGWSAWVKSCKLSYYDNPEKELTDKDIILNSFRNIKSLIKDKKRRGMDREELSDKEILDFVLTMVDDTVYYIENNVKDII